MKLIICLLIAVLLPQGLKAAPNTIQDLYQGSLTSDNSITYSNAALSEEFGFSAEAGDINNDGIPDFMISDSFYDNRKGIVYVVYGKRGTLRQFSSMSDFQATDGFIIKGALENERLGHSLNPAGDVNSDGIDDIIIGSFLWSGAGFGSETGVSYVIFGRNTSDFPHIIDLGNLSPTLGFRIIGETAYHQAGFSVDGAGDVNGDGISDIIIGAYNAYSEAGRAYVIFGRREGLADMRLPPAVGQGFTIKGTTGSHFGASVSKVGDFNGDGVDDIIIGGHTADGWRGYACIIYGKPGGFPATISTPPSASEGMMLEGAAGGDNFGCTVRDAGDFNGDGLKDVIIGALAGNGGRGSAYLILGSRVNPAVINVNSLSPSRGFTVMTGGYSQLGIYVSGGKDLNGDGLSDVIVAAPEGNANRGIVYVLYGKEGSSFSQVNVDDGLSGTQGFVISGIQEGGRFGAYLTPLKDVNGDGMNDLIIAAPFANDGRGTAYLLYSPWKCSEKCAGCSFNSSSCDVCVEGFGLLRGECVICPLRTHRLNNGVCIDKSLLTLRIVDGAPLELIVKTIDL